MLSQLWSNALADPPLLFAAVLVVIVVLVIGVVYAQIYREGRKAGITTAAELRKDAQTSERQKTLRKMQGRAAARGAFSRRQDLRANRTEKAPGR